jgi:hypothetical protein
LKFNTSSSRAAAAVAGGRLAAVVALADTAAALLANHLEAALQPSQRFRPALASNTP